MTEIIVTASIVLDEFTREDTTREMLQRAVHNGLVMKLRLPAGRKYDIVVTDIQAAPGVVTDHLLLRISSWLRQNPGQPTFRVAQQFRITEHLALSALLEGERRQLFRMDDDPVTRRRGVWFDAVPGGSPAS